MPERGPPGHPMRAERVCLSLNYLIARDGDLERRREGLGVGWCRRGMGCRWGGLLSSPVRMLTIAFQAGGHQQVLPRAVPHPLAMPGEQQPAAVAMPPRRVEAEPLCLREPSASAGRPPGYERTLTVSTSCRTSRRPFPTSPPSQRPCTSDKGKSLPTDGFSGGKSHLWRAGPRRRPPHLPKDVAGWSSFTSGWSSRFFPPKSGDGCGRVVLSRDLYIKQKRVRQAHPAIPCQFPFFDILLDTLLVLASLLPPRRLPLPNEKRPHSMSWGALDHSGEMTASVSLETRCSGTFPRRGPRQRPETRPKPSSLSWLIPHPTF